MDAAREQEPLIIKPKSKETNWPIIKPTSEEEIHEQVAEEIAKHAADAGHPTTPETVKGGKVLPISPEMKNIGVEPTSSDVPINVIKMVKEDVFGAQEDTYRVGYGESGHGLFNIIERVKGKLNLRNQKLKKAA